MDGLLAIIYITAMPFALLRLDKVILAKISYKLVIFEWLLNRNNWQDKKSGVCFLMYTWCIKEVIAAVLPQKTSVSAGFHLHQAETTPDLTFSISSSQSPINYQACLQFGCNGM